MVSSRGLGDVYKRQRLGGLNDAIVLALDVIKHPV
jgi:hypothetical protein